MKPPSSVCRHRPDKRGGAIDGVDMFGPMPTWQGCISQNFVMAAEAPQQTAAEPQDPAKLMLQLQTSSAKCDRGGVGTISVCSGIPKVYRMALFRVDVCTTR